jgi:hypothetical protein
MKAARNGIPEGDASSILGSWLQQRAQRQLSAQFKTENKQLWELPPSLQGRLDLPPSLQPITADSFTDGNFEDWGWIVVLSLICAVFVFLMYFDCASLCISGSPEFLLLNFFLSYPCLCETSFTTVPISMLVFVMDMFLSALCSEPICYKHYVFDCQGL